MSKHGRVADPTSLAEVSVSVMHGDPLRIALVGELDIVSADDAWAALEGCTTPGSPAVVDLGALAFLDCSGVTVIDRLAHRLEGAVLHLVNARPAAARLLSLTGTAQRPNIRMVPPRVSQPSRVERTLVSPG